MNSSHNDLQYELVISFQFEHTTRNKDQTERLDYCEAWVFVVEQDQHQIPRRTRVQVGGALGSETGQ